MKNALCLSAVAPENEEWPAPKDNDDENAKQRRQRRRLVCCDMHRVKTVTILLILFMVWVICGLAYFVKLQRQVQLERMEAMAVHLESMEPMTFVSSEQNAAMSKDHNFIFLK